jgi:glutamate 5-kinase
VGIVDVLGSFQAGDAVEIAEYAPPPLDPRVELSGSGPLLGKGICNYSADELRRVKGMKSTAVQEVLPRATEEAVHRDYMVLA